MFPDENENENETGSEVVEAVDEGESPKPTQDNASEQKSSTPIPETPPSSDDTPFEDADYESLSTDDDDDDLDVEPVVEGKDEQKAEPVKAEAPPKEEEPPTAEQKLEPVKPEVIPAPDQVAAEEPPKPTEPVDPAQVIPTPEETRANYQKARDEMQDLIATQHYQLSDKQVEALDENFREELPKLMARVYMDATTGAVAHMYSMLPQVVADVLTGRTQADQSQARFFEAWPQIDPQKHSNEVSRFGQVYRQMYPQATEEEFIRDVGAQVVVAQKLEANKEGVSVSPTSKASIQQPVSPPSAPVAPFQPAGGHARGGTPPPDNPFTSLSEALGEEELDLD